MIYELFPVAVRYSSASLVMNTSMALFGGTAPLFMTYLIRKTENPYAPCFYLIGGALVSLCFWLNLFKVEVWKSILKKQR